MSEAASTVALADGARLAVTLYRPDTPDRVPALLEALPYRKDDVTAADATWYRRLRDEGGFAVCRADVRGTGSSTGVAADEYPERETADLAGLVAWLAAQPWCSGRVGMFGTSYSGFNALHTAAAAPPALAAVCAIYASDDRYSDDVHYGGGVLRALDLLDYPLYMVALNALPPVPGLAGPGWRGAWQDRVDRLEPWLLRWLAEPHDGPYWRRGSLRPGADRIRCPTMLIAGWADGYRTGALRLFEALRGPRRLLVGPWAHMSPDRSRPGPRIDVLPELIRWFRHHLGPRAGEPDGHPPVTVFVREPTVPAPDLDRVRGRFRHEPAWPPARRRERVLGAGQALWPRGAARSGWSPLPVRGEVGVTGSIWCAGALPFGQPWDQRDDDVLGLVMDWPVEGRALEVLGMPRADVSLQTHLAAGTVGARLEDVFPDGTVALVARGLQVLGPMAADRAHRVRIALEATSWVFDPRHRIRLALATADWPSIWPPPLAGRVLVELGSVRLTLPVLEGAAPTGRAPSLEPGEPAASGAGRAHGDRRVAWRVVDDGVARERRVEIDHGASARLPDGGWVRERYAGHVGVALDDPRQARATGFAWYAMGFPQATVGTRADLDVRGHPRGLSVRLRLRVRERGRAGRERRWDRTYPGGVQWR